MVNSPTSSLGPRGRGPAGGGWPEEVKRWPAHNFRVRGSSCVHGEWRHCATSGRGAPGMGGERYAAATFLGPASGDSALFTGPGRPRSHPVRLTHLMGPVFHTSGRSGAGAGARNGAAGGSFRSALVGRFVGTAESCGNRRMRPVRRPERSSRSARTGIRWGRRAPPGPPTRTDPPEIATDPLADADQPARDRGPAAQGRPGRSRRTRREPTRPPTRTRAPPWPRPIPRRGARETCRDGAGEVI